MVLCCTKRKESGKGRRGQNRCAALIAVFTMGLLKTWGNETSVLILERRDDGYARAGVVVWMVSIKSCVGLPLAAKPRPGNIASAKQVVHARLGRRQSS